MTGTDLAPNLTFAFNGAVLFFFTQMAILMYRHEKSGYIFYLSDILLELSIKRLTFFI